MSTAIASRPARLGSLATIVAALLLATTPLATAADPPGSGRAWPDGRIKVFNAAKADQRAVDLAMAAWNATGSRVRFVGVERRALAQVVVLYNPGLPACGTGFGSIGYPGPGGVAAVQIRKGGVAQGQSCAWPGQAGVVTHELGHVLGFPHVERQCSRMNPVSSEGRAPKLCIPIASGPQEAYVKNEYIGRWRCGLLEPIDVTRMLRRYGGRAPARPADPWCDLYPPIDPPGPLTLTREEADDGNGGTQAVVRVEFRRPANPILPPFIAADTALAAATLREMFHLYRTVGSCPTARPLHPFLPPPGMTLLDMGVWSVAAGATQTVVDYGFGPGPLCYSAWSWDTAGRPSRTSVQATIAI